MGKIKQELLRYKWVFVIGVVVALSMGVLAANLHVIQFMQLRMQENTQGIVRLLKRDVKNKARQDDWHFKEGIKYLLEDAEEESLQFFEEHLGDMVLERQYDIVRGYNKKNLLFRSHTAFMQLLMQDLENETAKAYLKRMEPEVLDQELVHYFGDKLQITTSFVDTFYQLLAAYPKWLPLNAFQFNLYELMILEGEELAAKKDTIFSKLEPNAAKALLFKELKTKPVDIDKFSEWIEFLHKNKVLTSQEYAAFSNYYREFQLARMQYKGIDSKKVDLVNKKQMIELQIGDKTKLLETNMASINGLKFDVTSLEKELEKLTDYALMAFYIDKSYGNGEYQASVPRKSFFGNYTSSSQKYILKLNTTQFYQEGVYYVDVYLNGTKVASDKNEYPYYIEVPRENLERIEALIRLREQQLEEINHLTEEAGKLQQEVDAIKKETGYDDTEEALKNIESERENLRRKVDEKIIQIKNMFEIGNISISDLE